ncbi:MAG: rhamnan synthesis F family protein [Candidatus Peregrinibacteria bacterium]
MPTIDFYGREIIFDEPERADTTSAWLPMTPFAFFLIDALRPSVFVELGVHTGVSYSAFCQATQKLRLPTKCFGVDTWRGDAHSLLYGEEVYEEFRVYHAAHFSAHSALLRMTFDEALPMFEDASIDLLHIDGYHTYDAVRHDFEAWLPKMSEQGVMVFHDICLKEKDFGVWKLWDEIKDRFPSFALSFDAGLGVLAVGRSVPPGFLRLLSEVARDPFFAGLFRSLGRAVTRKQKVLMLEKAVALLGKHLQASRAQERMLQSEVGISRAQERILREELRAARAKEGALGEKLLQREAEKVGLQDALHTLGHSLSYRVGCAMTWLPRRVYKFLFVRSWITQRQGCTLCVSRARAFFGGAACVSGWCVHPLGIAKLFLRVGEEEMPCTYGLLHFGVPPHLARSSSAGSAPVGFAGRCMLLRGGKLRFRVLLADGQEVVCPVPVRLSPRSLRNRVCHGAGQLRLRFLSIQETILCFINPRPPPAPARVAVLIHLYYEHLWEELFWHVRRIPPSCPVTVFVNLVAGHTEEILRRIKRDCPDAVITVTLNRGFDVAGLVAQMDHMDFSRFDLVCKIHSKMSVHDRAGGRWRRTLLKALLGSRSRCADILSLFRDRPEVGIVGCAEYIERRMGANQSFLTALCKRLALPEEPEDTVFFGGTMFWIRADILWRLHDHHFSIDEFNASGNAFDGQLAHAFERVFIPLCRSRGFRACSVSARTGNIEEV